jgi:hypothetical protein
VKILVSANTGGTPKENPSYNPDLASDFWALPTPKKSRNITPTQR